MPSSELSGVFFFTYVLYSRSHKRFYIGFSSNISKRLEEHNKGLNDSTKPYAPWELIYYEAHLNKEDAERREKYLKTTQGKQGLRKMLRCYLSTIEDSSLQKGYY